MLISVRFPESIKLYTYNAPEGTKRGIYYLDGGFVIVVGEATKKPTFEVKEFKGIYVQDELKRIHIKDCADALIDENYVYLEESVKMLNILRAGMLDKYVNIAHVGIIREYVDWLL